MTKISAVIFDMDGTIIDSRLVVLGSFKYVVEKHGGVYDEALASSFVGRVLEDTYAALLPDHDPAEVVQIHRQWQAEHKDMFKIYDGLHELFEWLKSQNIKIGAYTSAIRTRTDMAVEVLGLDGMFDAMICGDEVDLPKPDKDGVEKVAKLLDSPLDEVIFVGDATHDIGSGKHAGVVTIGITHGFGTREALQEAGADYLVDNLAELKQELEELTHGS